MITILNWTNFVRKLRPEPIHRIVTWDRATTESAKLSSSKCLEKSETGSWNKTLFNFRQEFFEVREWGGEIR
jgi:hypothetical protein